MFNSRSEAARPAETPTAAATIAVDDLRVGMYIHLDGGWLSHPFARSSFRIAHVQQIATLRGLKLARVRWSPELSDVDEAPLGRLPAGTGVHIGTAAPSGPAAPSSKAASSAAATSCATPGVPGTAAPADAHAAASPAATGRLAEEAATARRSAALATERLAQQQCEQQFSEATAAWRRAGDVLTADPARARTQAGALADALTDKLMTDGDVGIRLLPVSGNDRAAAHALNVTVVSMLLARALGQTREEVSELALGALLHDVGKLDLPERVRHVEAGSSAAELSAYRDHVARGVAAGRRMALPDGALAVVAQHHEHADASGFPQRLSGSQLSLASRIVAIVNRYDNLCNPATRTPPLTPHEAVAMLFAHGRSRYDASVLNAFIRMMGVYPAGSLVQLTDERYAMVVAVNSTRPLKPRVLVHEAKVPRSEALLLDLEREPDVGIRRSLPAAKVPALALQYLDPRPRVAYFFEPIGSAPETARSAAEHAEA
jgi:putative nucleotidyltransferase with HDIG domain